MSYRGRFNGPEYNALYLLTGKFDNKFGPTVTGQFPKCIPGFTHSNPNGVSQLASLLIPNNVEHKTSAGADCNVFTLYWNSTTSEYQLLPPVDKQMDEDDKNPGQVFFINAVRAQADKDDSRGAKIRSIALGLTLSNVEIVKPLLLLALEHLMQSEDEINESFVLTCLNALNSLDLAAVRRILEHSTLQQMLQTVVERETLNSALDDNSETGPRVRRMLDLKRRDKYGNRVMLDKGRIRIYFDQYDASREYRNLLTTPLSVDLVACLPMRASICRRPILVFLQKLIPTLEKIPSTNYSFKIIINSEELSKEQICRFVIGLSSLMGSPNNSRHPESYDSSSVICLPYVEISMINSIRKSFADHHKPFTFYLIGTANPIFKHHTDLWDFHYDIDNETLLESKEKSNTERNSLWDPQLLKRFWHMNMNDTAFFQSEDQTRMGLLARFLIEIQRENPKRTEALGALKRINVLQVVHLSELMSNSKHHNLNLLHSYLINYKELLRFDEFFEPESLQCIRWFRTMNSIVDLLFLPKKDIVEMQEGLVRLRELLLKVLNYISSDGTHVEKFVAIGGNFPFLGLFLDDIIPRKDFSNVNLSKELRDSWKRSKSWLQVTEDEENTSVIRYFVKNRSLSLLALPLLLSSNLRRPKNLRNDTIEKSSGYFATPISATASSDNDYEPTRPRSMSLKWMLNLTSPRNRDSLLDTISLRSFSDTSSYSISSPRNSSVMTGVGNESSSSISSASSSANVATPRASFKTLRTETDKIKRLSCQILSLIDENPIGEILIKTSLSPFLLLVYRECKIKLKRETEYLSHS